MPIKFNTNCIYFLEPRWRLRPRVLTGVDRVDTSTKILGKTISFPLGIAPSAFVKLLHPDGEIGLAKGTNARIFY